MKRTTLLRENSHQRMVRLVGGHYFQGMYWQGIAMFPYGVELSAMSLSKHALKKAKSQHEDSMRKFKALGTGSSGTAATGNSQRSAGSTEEKKKKKKSSTLGNPFVGSAVVSEEEVNPSATTTSSSSTAVAASNSNQVVKEWTGQSFDLDPSLPSYDLLLKTNPGAFEPVVDGHTKWTSQKKREVFLQLLSAPDRPPLGQLFYILSHPEAYIELLRQFDHDPYFVEQLQYLTGSISQMRQLPDDVSVGATTAELLGASPVPGADMDPIQEIQRLEAMEKERLGLPCTEEERRLLLTGLPPHILADKTEPKPLAKPLTDRERAYWRAEIPTTPEAEAAWRSGEGANKGSFPLDPEHPKIPASVEAAANQVPVSSSTAADVGEEVRDISASAAPTTTPLKGLEDADRIQRQLVANEQLASGPKRSVPPISSKKKSMNTPALPADHSEPKGGAGESQEDKEATTADDSSFFAHRKTTAVLESANSEKLEALRAKVSQPAATSNTLNKNDSAAEEAATGAENGNTTTTSSSATSKEDDVLSVEDSSTTAAEEEKKMDQQQEEEKVHTQRRQQQQHDDDNNVKPPNETTAGGEKKAEEDYDRFLNLSVEELKKEQDAKLNEKTKEAKERATTFHSEDLFVWWEFSRFLINNESAFETLCDAAVKDIKDGRLSSAHSAHSLLLDIRSLILEDCHHRLLTDSSFDPEGLLSFDLAVPSTPAAANTSKQTISGGYNPLVRVKRRNSADGEDQTRKKKKPVVKLRTLGAGGVSNRMKSSGEQGDEENGVPLEVPHAVLTNTVIQLAPRQIGIVFAKQAAVAAIAERDLSQACLYLYSAACHMQLTSREWGPIFEVIPTATAEEMEIVKRLVVKILTGPDALAKNPAMGLRALSLQQSAEFTKAIILPFAKKKTKEWYTLNKYLLLWMGTGFIFALACFALYWFDIRYGYYDPMGGQRGAKALTVLSVDAKDGTTAFQRYQEGMDAAKKWGDYERDRRYKSKEDVNRYFENKRREEAGEAPLPDPRSNPDYVNKKKAEFMAEMEKRKKIGSVIRQADPDFDPNEADGRKVERYDPGGSNSHIAHWKTGAVYGMGSRIDYNSLED